MRRSRTAAVLAAVVATIVATVGVTAGTANAGKITKGGDAGRSERWLTCPNGKPPGKGQVTRVSLYYEGLWWLKFEGTIDRCVKPGRSDVFAIVTVPRPGPAQGPVSHQSLCGCRPFRPVPGRGGADRTRPAGRLPE